nr:MAG: hypothetical protein GM42_0390 [actinobacterium acMicro-1]
MATAVYDVAIVGGGISGMAAADRLVAAGRSVVVLEANNRIGGRTWSSTDEPGGPVDFGGMYIGETHSHLLELGRSLGLETTSAVAQGTDVYLVGGERILAPDGVFPLQVEYAEEFRSSFKRLDEVARAVGWREPWASPDSEHLDSITVAEWIESNVTHASVKLLHHHAVNSVLGASASEVSMLYWAYYIDQCEGIESLLAARGGAQNEWWVGGTAQISELIAAKLGSGVRTDFPVSSIDTSKGVVILKSDSNEEVRATEVIIAMSPANAHRIRFSPQLPEPRAQLQMRSPMARMVKIVLRFEKAFWRTNGLSGVIMNSDEHALLMFPGTKPTDSAETLIAFIGGEYRDEWAKPNPETRKANILAFLERAFDAKPGPLVYYSETDWTLQPWAQGGPVTFMPPGVMSQAGASLRDPIGPIHFAGTEASHMWSGYLEGGVRAGQSAAEAVLKAS